MQKRIKRLLYHTLDDLRSLQDSPFAENAAACAFEDAFFYAQYIDDNEKADYLLELERLQDRFFQNDLADLDRLFRSVLKKTESLTSTLSVDFIVLRRSHWGAVKPLAEAFRQAGCAVRLIPTPMLQETQDQWGSAFAALIAGDGMEPTDFRQYDIETALPDLVIDNMAVDCAKIPEFRFLRIASAADCIVHVEHSVLTGYNEAMKRSYFRIGRSRCWQYLVPAPVFQNAFPLIMRIDGAFLAKGCPEMDSVFQSQLYPESHSGTVLLWNVDALDPEYEIAGDYERLEKEIAFLEIVAARFPGIVSIVRPHPNFYNQRKCRALLRELQRIARSRANVRFDTAPTIYGSYRNADAMITWMSSTTLFTFAATGKPVIVLPTFITGGYDTMLDMHLLSVLPIAYTAEDMVRFVENIRNDTAREKRMEVFSEYLGPIDGTACTQIVQEVLNRYEKLFH